jgi:BolA family transcriptional regulator, general stress-responsive regulator
VKENSVTGDVATAVQLALEQNLTLSHLEIIDDSSKHVGHKHFNEAKKYFTIKITALEFANKSLLESHKMIYLHLNDLIESSIHAISIKIIK